MQEMIFSWTCARPLFLWVRIQYGICAVSLILYSEDLEGFCVSNQASGLKERVFVGYEIIGYFKNVGNLKASKMLRS
jgi:hypothetical protein